MNIRGRPWTLVPDYFGGQEITKCVDLLACMRMSA
jgi:hypothetical protein